MEFNISKNSWHFWLQNFGANEKYWGSYGTDICTYTRRVFWGLVRLTALSLLIAALIYSLGDFFCWIYLLIVGPYIGPGIGAFMITMLLGVFSLLLVIAGGVKGVETIKNAHREKQRNSPPKDPSFLTLAYRKFKEKTCFRLTVIDNE